MEDVEFVAILDRSDGNEKVGEMWQETKVFSHDTALWDVMKWAQSCHRPYRDVKPEEFRGRLTITVKQ